MGWNYHQPQFLCLVFFRPTIIVFYSKYHGFKVQRRSQKSDKFSDQKEKIFKRHSTSLSFIFYFCLYNTQIEML